LCSVTCVNKNVDDDGGRWRRDLSVAFRSAVLPFAGSSKFKLRLDSVVEQITHKRSHMQRCTTAQDTRTTGKNKKKPQRTEKKRLIRLICFEYITSKKNHYFSLYYLIIIYNFFFFWKCSAHGRLYPSLKPQILA